MEPSKNSKSQREVEGLLGFGKENEPDNLAVQLSDRVHKLEYIFDMLGEMRTIALQADALSLVYYLEMAAIETSESCDAIKFRLDALNDSNRP